MVTKFYSKLFIPNAFGEGIRDLIVIEVSKNIQPDVQQIINSNIPMF